MADELNPKALDGEHVLLVGKYYSEAYGMNNKEYVCRLCIRPQPKWMPTWLYNRILARILVMHEFEPCLRCRCGVIIQ